MLSETKPVLLHNVPIDLWRQVKSAAASKGITVTDEVVGILMRRYSETAGTEALERRHLFHDPATGRPSTADVDGKGASFTKLHVRVVEAPPEPPANIVSALHRAEVIYEDPAAVDNLKTVPLAEAPPEWKRDLCLRPLSGLVGHVCQLPKGHDGRCPKK